MDTRERRLNEALRVLADTDRSLDASAETKRAVMARWDAMHRERATPVHWRASLQGRTVAWMPAAAAVLLVVVVASMWRSIEPAMTLRMATPDGTRDGRLFAHVPQDSGVFVPLGLIAPRELERSSFQLMRVQLRGAMLNRLGVMVYDTWASEVIEADVLFGEDGIARAIRIER